MPIKLIKRPNLRGIKSNISNASNKFLKEVGEEYVEALEKVTGNWVNSPTFEVEIKKFARLKVKVKQDKAGQIFMWVNYGTGEKAGGSRYKIRAKPGGVLSFNAGYTPKTTKSSYGGPGTASGERVFTQEVTHLGIEPRRLDEQARKIVMRNTPNKFKKLMKYAIFGRSK